MKFFIVNIEGLPSQESIIEADPVVEEKIEPMVIIDQPVATECVNVENEKSLGSLTRIVMRKIHILMLTDLSESLFYQYQIIINIKSVLLNKETNKSKF